MARLKIPDVSNPQAKSDDTTGNINNADSLNLNNADFSKDSLNGELTNASPVILTPEQYIEMFGDSEDDNDHNFHGFEEDSRSIRNPKMTPINEKTNARRFFKRQLSPTDESNPYKKKYLSYTKDRSKSRKSELPHGCYSNSPPDKENKLSLSNDCQQRGNNINKTAKNLVNKAYKVKHRKTLISPLKVSSKYSRIVRPRRKQKLNFNSDFIYDPPVKKQRCNKETISDTTNLPAIPKEIKNIVEETQKVCEEIPNPVEGTNILECTVKDEDIWDDVADSSVAVDADVNAADGTDDVTKLVKKKKARIKFATESDLLPGFKKKAKMKNLTSNQQHDRDDSPYEIATFSDLSLAHIKDEPHSPHPVQDEASREENFTDIFINYCGEGENLLSPSSSVSEVKDSFTGLLLEDADGNYKSLMVDRPIQKMEEFSDDDDFQLDKKTFCTRKERRTKRNNQPFVVLTDYLSDSNWNVGRREIKGLLSERERGWPFWKSYCNDKLTVKSAGRFLRERNGKNNSTNESCKQHTVNKSQQKLVEIKRFPVRDKKRNNNKLLNISSRVNRHSKLVSSKVSKYPRRDSIIKREKLSYINGILQLDDDKKFNVGRKHFKGKRSTNIYKSTTFSNIKNDSIKKSEAIVQTQKRGRGRPRKNNLDSSLVSPKNSLSNTTMCKKGNIQTSHKLRKRISQTPAVLQKNQLEKHVQSKKNIPNALQASDKLKTNDLQKPAELPKNELEKTLNKKKKIANPLQLKVIKRNGKIQTVNFNNELITFCGSCDNCTKKVDCGECKHCRNTAGHVIRLLPCWQRRCLTPIIGEFVQLNKIGKSETPDKKENEAVPSEDIKDESSTPIKVDKIKQEEEDTHEEAERSLEKVEVCLVSDNPIVSPSKEGEEIEFHVHHSHKKTRKKDQSSSDIDVFTGMSPIKPKLRSTMNELITRTDPMDTILPRIEFGPETLAKLPWPNDTSEDAAWVSGHHVCLTTPMDLDLWNLCFLCGSAGKEKMLICNFCCETFHPYCLDVDPIDYKNWCCDRCKRCIVCGFKENLLMCDTCHDCYHADCLGPFYQRDTEGDEETWVCGKCVKCTKCGQRRAGKVKTSKWMFDFSMCEDCGINWKKGNYCPVCRNIYGDHDDHLKMMCCCQCDQWIHMECEGISIDEYEILADLPDSIPYICKICSGKDKLTTTWYKEVQEELKGGFLKIYYDVTSHKDLKLVKKQLGEIQAITSSLEIFDVVFHSIEECKFSCVNEFHLFMSEAIKQLSLTIKEVAVADVPLSFYPNIDRLENYFEKALKNTFPWFSRVHVPAEKKPPDPFPLEPSTLKNKETLLHDHTYADKLVKNEPLKDDSSSQDENEEWAFNILLDDEKPKPKKRVDIRRCIFCNHFGDGEACNTGRLLYAGVNEWVHINCALWSAEVYEDDDGRLKHVHDALKRGNKLKCDCCDQLGATIGCCSLKCPKSYHFYCANKSGVVFLDDKKIYCEAHASKANKNLILTTAELSVPRRVVVDLTRFKSLKRVQRGLDPRSINVYCGGFSLHSLGALSEYSDVKRALIPIGYRVTRIFWSSKRPTHRCKYTCEIQVLHHQEKAEMEKEIISPDVVIGETITYCHDSKEWQQIKDRTVCNCKPASKRKSKKGTKRKIDFTFPCEKCIANQKYVYEKHSDFMKSKTTSTCRKNRLTTEEDHNFFPIINSEKVELKDVQKNEDSSEIFHKNDNTNEKVNEFKCTLISNTNNVSLMHMIPVTKSGFTCTKTSINNMKNIETPLDEKEEFEKTNTLKEVGSYTICNEKKQTDNEIAQVTLGVKTCVSVPVVCTCTCVPVASTSVVYQSCIVNNRFSAEKLLNPNERQLHTNDDKITCNLSVSDPSLSINNNSLNKKTQNSILSSFGDVVNSQGSSLLPKVDVKDHYFTKSNSSHVEFNYSGDVINYSNISVCNQPSTTDINVTYTKVIKCPNLTVNNTFSNFNTAIPTEENMNKDYRSALTIVSSGKITPCIGDISYNNYSPIPNSNTVVSSQAILFNVGNSYTISSAVPDVIAEVITSDKNKNIYNGQVHHSGPVNHTQQNNYTLSPLQVLNVAANPKQVNINSRSKSSPLQVLNVPANPEQVNINSRYKSSPLQVLNVPANPEQVNINSRSNIAKKNHSIHTEILKMRNNLYHKLSQGYKGDAKSSCINQFVLGHASQLMGIELNSCAQTTNTSHMYPTVDISSTTCTQTCVSALNIPLGHIVKPVPPLQSYDQRNCKLYDSQPVAFSQTNIENSPIKTDDYTQLHKTLFQDFTGQVPNSLLNPRNMCNNYIGGVSSQKSLQNITLPAIPAVSSPSFISALHQRNPSSDNQALLKDATISKQINSYLYKLGQSSEINSLGNYSYKVESQPAAVVEQLHKYPSFHKNLESKRVISDPTVTEMDETLQGKKRKMMVSPTRTISNTKLKMSPPLDFKRDLLFRQLKEYLTKHPNVINLVGNVASKEKEGNVPVVNLTEPKSNRDSLCYSVYLPEHLWNDLVNAGIAKNDIQKILRENTLQSKCTKSSTLSHSSNGFLPDNLSYEKFIPTNLQNRLHLPPEQPKIISQTQNGYRKRYQTIIPSPPNNQRICPKPPVIKNITPLYSPFVSAANKTVEIRKPMNGIPYNCIVTQPIVHRSNFTNSASSVSGRSSVSQITHTSQSYTGPQINHTSQGCIVPQITCTSQSFSYAHPLPIRPYYKSNSSINNPLSGYSDISCETSSNNSSAKTIYNVSSIDSLPISSSHINFTCSQLTSNTYNNNGIPNCVNTNVYKYYNYPHIDGNISHVSSINKLLCKELPLSHDKYSPASRKNDYYYTNPPFKHKEHVDRQSCYKPETSISSGVNSTPLKPKRKYKKRIQTANVVDIEKNKDFTTGACYLTHTFNLEDKSNSVNNSLKSGPVMRKKKEKTISTNVISANTEIDFCTFDANTCGDKFFDTSLPADDLHISPEKQPRKKKFPKKQKKNYLQSLKNCLHKQETCEKMKTETSLKFVVKNEDGWEYDCSSLLELWKVLIGEINDKRMEIKLSPFQIDLNDAYEFMGVTKEFIAYLVEQLPGGHKCRNYKFQHHLPCLREDDNDLPINPKGFARGEVAVRNAENDMFAWLASPYRIPPKFGDEPVEEEVLGGTQDLPVAMKYRFLKNTSKDHVGVFRSKIQGRGLYCKKTIEGGDMIIEYSGELIRASLTDRREEYYEKQGIGCYMFRIDDMEVVDATMKGNAARFINHSCEPNCYSKIITVDGCKKIVIFAVRRIFVGEELTYDYKFSHEEDKLPCYCGAKKCRKYMN